MRNMNKDILFIKALGPKIGHDVTPYHTHYQEVSQLLCQAPQNSFLKDCYASAHVCFIVHC